MSFLDTIFGNSANKKKKYIKSVHIRKLRCPRCKGTRFSRSELNKGDDGDSLDEFSDRCLRCNFRIKHDIYGRPLRYKVGRRYIIKRVYKRKVRKYRRR